MSSLLYSEKLVWERNKKVGLSILPIFVPVIAGFFAPIYLLPYSLGKLVLGAYLPFFVLGLIYMVYRGNLVYRSYRTRADQETAKILGKDLILNTLLKIDAMHLPNLEAEKMRRRLSRTMWRPNISDRIALLRDMNSWLDFASSLLPLRSIVAQGLGRIYRWRGSFYYYKRRYDPSIGPFIHLSWPLSDVSYPIPIPWISTLPPRRADESEGPAD